MSNRKWESDMANEKFEERHIICEVRSKSLDSRCSYLVTMV
jgi:hypothetical protein